jgi:hypothetical protein
VVGFTALVALGFRMVGAWRASFLAYNLPIALPFAAFFVDRWQGWPRLQALDVLVIVLALARVVSPFPYASGHVLFMTYAALTARGWALRWLAIVTLLGALAYKLLVWHDTVSPLLGLALATLAALAERRLGPDGNTRRNGGTEE